MKKIYYITVFMAFVIMCISSCKKWENPQFQEPVYSGKKANKTIADIKARQTQSGSIDSICQYSGQHFIVRAMVVSSDEGGNCYKYITVQDKTGGIEIGIDQNSLFNEYPVGQIVYINCDGLVVGDYHNKPQIGWIYENSIGRINYMMLNRYLSKDSLPDINKLDQFSSCGGIFEINSDADVSDNLVNCLCTIKKAKFKSTCHGLQLASDLTNCDRDLSNFTITVRTSNYAKFRNIIIDANKEYNLTGILSKYNNKYQFVLRTAEDIQAVGQDPGQPQETEVLVQGIGFDDNSFTTGGWTQSTTDAWTCKSSGTGYYMQHDPDTMCDDWLISPEIYIEQADCYLKVEHRLKENLSPDPNHMYYQIYYSTNYQEGTFNPDDWHAYNVTVYPSNFGYSNALTPVPQGNIRIAIRYNKQGSTAMGLDAWAIRKLNFYRTEWR